MRIARTGMVLFVLFTAFLIQSAWLSLLNFPVIVPPLLVIVAAAFCLRREPLNAALIGFTTGIILDLFPPSQTPLGTSSFALVLIFFFVYQIRPVIEGSLLLPVVAIAIVPAAYLFLSTIIRLFLSEQSLSIIEVLADGIVLTLYGLILGTFALPITQWLDRMFTPREIAMGRLR
jgi:rod shape-determining protein MreD